MTFKKITQNRVVSTLDREVRFTGPGLHTGVKSELTITGNDTDEIIFSHNGRRTNLNPFRIHNEGRTTSVVDSNIEIVAMTVEHLLSALYGLSLQGVTCHLEGECEVPILNGAADIFYDEIKKACIQTRKDVQLVAVEHDLTIRDDKDPNRYIHLKPAKGGGLSVTASVTYDQSSFGSQSFTYRDSAQSYRAEIAPYRTSYPFNIDSEDDLRVVKSRLRGAQFDGADTNVTLWDTRHSNTPPLAGDQIARHKILDFTGDLLASGYLGFDGTEMVLESTGHALHNKLARQIALALDYEQ